MKRLFILVAIILLQSCYYSDGCFYSPQSVSCVDKGKMFPAIAHYQKLDTIGKTDPQQRWKDAVSCGAEYGDSALKKIDDNNREKFWSCMEKKGYKKFWPAECGYQNPKWDKGVCNL